MSLYNLILIIKFILIWLLNKDIQMILKSSQETILVIKLHLLLDLHFVQVFYWELVKDLKMGIPNLLKCQKNLLLIISLIL